MQGSDIARFLGNFESKIANLEVSVDRLEASVEKLSITMAERKGGWHLLLMLGTVSAVIGSTLHKPIEALISFFR